MTILLLRFAGPPSVFALTYYADGVWGDNAYDGLSPMAADGHGPKRNVSTAINAAADLSEISIAGGFYQEFVWNPGSKTLTLRPQGKVTLYNTDPYQTDSDGDQMADGWEQQYGLLPFNPADALLNADSDAENNLEEFLAGTDPTDANSVFRLVAITLEGDNIRIVWTCVAGKSYAVETNAVAGTGFNEVDPVISVPVDYLGSVTNYLHLGGGLLNQQFYQVKIAPPAP